MKERKLMNETNTELLSTDLWRDSNVMQSAWELMNGKWDTALSNNSPALILLRHLSPTDCLDNMGLCLKYRIHSDAI